MHFKLAFSTLQTITNIRFTSLSASCLPSLTALFIMWHGHSAVFRISVPNFVLRLPRGWLWTVISSGLYRRAVRRTNRLRLQHRNITHTKKQAANIALQDISYGILMAVSSKAAKLDESYKCRRNMSPPSSGLKNKLSLTPFTCWFLAWSILRFWKRRHVSPKRRDSSELYCVTTKKAVYVLIFSCYKTCHFICFLRLLSEEHMKFNISILTKILACT
jgi:hypothetical protein